MEGDIKPIVNPSLESSASLSPQDQKKRNRAICLICVITLVLGLGWFCFWFFYGRFYISTDDAYVHGNRVMLTPQVTAGVAAIYTDETDWVTKGQVVVDLDTTTSTLRFEKAKEELGVTVRRVVGYFYEVEARDADLTLQNAILHQAQLDLNHRQGLAATGAISQEEFEQYTTAVEVALQRVEASYRQVEIAKARVSGVTLRTHPEVLAVVKEVQRAYLDLIYCKVLAPATGYVAKRRAQVGDLVLIGQPLLEIIPLDEIWIEANYKETQLKRIRTGQSVTFSADMHGEGVKYHGHIVGFQPGSGNAFALLPPQNASGNWIKIVQRIPIRINVLPEENRQHPLLLGVSLDVATDTHDLSGEMLRPFTAEKAVYTTDIYTMQQQQLEAIMPLIEQIIDNNS